MDMSTANILTNNNFSLNVGNPMKVEYPSIQDLLTTGPRLIWSDDIFYTQHKACLPRFSE